MTEPVCEKDALLGISVLISVLLWDCFDCWYNDGFNLLASRESYRRETLLVLFRTEGFGCRLGRPAKTEEPPLGTCVCIATEGAITDFACFSWADFLSS
jgi:hypothetical protein